MKKSYLDVGCTFCGVKPGERCIVTLAEEGQQELSIQWQHRTRELLAVAS
jgi:uncharacterized protein YcbX